MRESRKTSADHPHTRGENVSIDDESERFDGPSPHAWGKPGVVFSTVIPTRVGKPIVTDHVGPSPHAWGKRSSARRLDVLTSDHPHTRGENVHAADCVVVTSRIIPTRVGKTDTASDCNAVLTGPSPHAWGKRASRSAASLSDVGPSPHAWGKRRSRLVDESRSDGPSPHAWGKRLDRASDCRSQCRIIPTRVGKTDSRADHVHRAVGPSPHAWGKPDAQLLDPHRYADHPHTRGENYSRWMHSMRPDHPHTRGENQYAAIIERSDSGPSPHAWGKPSFERSIVVAMYGPSPHAWGKLDNRHAGYRLTATDHPHTRGENVTQRLLRTIPTRVGKTDPVSRRPDHPHTRGENARHNTRQPISDLGPSPHAWGKHRAKRIRAPDVGPSPHAWGKLSTIHSCSCEVVGPSPHAWGKLCHLATE